LGQNPLLDEPGEPQVFSDRSPLRINDSPLPQ